MTVTASSDPLPQKTSFLFAYKFTNPVQVHIYRPVVPHASGAIGDVEMAHPRETPARMHTTMTPTKDYPTVRRRTSDCLDQTSPTLRRERTDIKFAVVMRTPCIQERWMPPSPQREPPLTLHQLLSLSAQSFPHITAHTSIHRVCRLHDPRNLTADTPIAPSSKISRDIWTDPSRAVADWELLPAQTERRPFRTPNTRVFRRQR